MTDLRQGVSDTIHAILDELATLDHLDTPLAALMEAEKLRPWLKPATPEAWEARAITAAAHWIRYAELVAANSAIVRKAQEPA
jgi:hypothetical protein